MYVYDTVGYNTHFYMFDILKILEMSHMLCVYAYGIFILKNVQLKINNTKKTTNSYNIYLCNFTNM